MTAQFQFFESVAPGLSAADEDVMSSGKTDGPGLLGHHVWACPPAVQVRVTPTLILEPPPA